MKYTIRGEKVEITEAIKDYITKKLQRIDRYFENPENINAMVVARIRGREQIIEVTVPTKSFTIRSEESNEDLYAAIDLVIDKIERQIRKNKTKIMAKLRRDDITGFMAHSFDGDDDEGKLIVKRKHIEMKPMSEEEAIMQMNLLSHQFFVFRDDTSDTIKIVYIRKDGNYGILETD